MTSPNSIVFNNDTFIQNLQLVLAQVSTTPSSLLSFKYLVGYTGYPSGNLQGFFQTFQQVGNPFTTLAAFQAAWKKYSGDTSNTLTNDLVSDFRSILNMGASGDPSNDWAALGVKADQVPQLLSGSFGQFLSDYQYQSDGSVGGTSNAVTAFFTQWVQSMTVTSSLQTATGTSSGISLATYQQVYNAFGFPASQFASTLKTFYNNYVQSAATASNPDNVIGWFVPSQAFAAWFQQMQTNYITSRAASATVSSDKLDVINRILKLLIGLVGTLENISAAQAQRLNFLSNWQSAYTTLLSNIPVITQGGNNPISGTDSGSVNSRQSASTVTSTAQTNIQGFQTNVQDIAKQMQSTVSQSQDAANQQTDMCTSILQEMDTILSQIFR